MTEFPGIYVNTNSGYMSTTNSEIAINTSSNTGSSSGGTSGGGSGSTGSGVGIKSITQTTTSYIDRGANIIECALTDGQTSTFTIRNGGAGSQGEQGERGRGYLVVKSIPTHQPGKYQGIDVEWVMPLSKILSESGESRVLVGDILVFQSRYHYTVLATNSYDAYLGPRIDIRGPSGASGTDGVSPVISIEEITGGNRVTIIDANGEQSFDVMDGTGSGSGGVVEESDPTVPAWAKEPTKPTYTADEVGAIADASDVLQSKHYGANSILSTKLADNAVWPRHVSDLVWDEVDNRINAALGVIENGTY